MTLDDGIQSSCLPTVAMVSKLCFAVGLPTNMTLVNYVSSHSVGPLNSQLLIVLIS